MKMNPVRLANALAISQGILSVLCAALYYLVPGVLIGVVRSLSHPLDISPLVPVEPPPIVFRELLFGLVSWMVFAWLSGWLLGLVYNAFVPSHASETGRRNSEKEERLAA